MTIVLIAVSCSTSATSNNSDESVNETQGSQVIREDWGEVFADADANGTFVLREVGSNITKVWNPERAGEARIPASTFKILNSLIILETGVLADTETQVPWDGVTRGVPDWNQDHSLRTGIAVSAVWAYQELARQVGEDQMQDWVSVVNYGNAEIGGGIDQFWLTGNLRISPTQQVDFLEDFVQGDLPFSDKTLESVADILIREQGENWSWSHKTGTALSEDPSLGWLVGYTRYEDRTSVFAMNLDLRSVTDIGTQLDPQVRQIIARTILTSEGALPE